MWYRSVGCNLGPLFCQSSNVGDYNYTQGSHHRQGRIQEGARGGGGGVPSAGLGLAAAIINFPCFFGSREALS